MFALMIAPARLKMGHLGSKTRSLGEILEKPCVALEATFLAPLAEGQRAIVMAWGRRPSVRACVRASVRELFL